MADVGYSLAGRSVFEHRAVVVGGERESLLGGLSALAVGEPAAGVIEGVARVTVAGWPFCSPARAPSVWYGPGAL